MRASIEVAELFAQNNEKKKLIRKDENLKENRNSLDMLQGMKCESIFVFENLCVLREKMFTTSLD